MITARDNQIVSRMLFTPEAHFKCQQSDDVPIICHQCSWLRWCTWTSEYLWEISNKIEMTLTLFLRAWRKMIREKNLKQKISWHCPFKLLLIFGRWARLGVMTPGAHLLDVCNISQVNITISQVNITISQVYYNFTGILRFHRYILQFHR